VVKKLGIAGLSLIGFLVVAEVGYRIYEQGWRRRSLASRDPARLVTQPVADRRIYRLRPDVPGFTNSHGFRDLERTRNRSAGTYRVAVIGDSVTMQRRIPFEALYVSRLQKAFDESLGEGRVELLNFGVTGYGTAQQLALLRSVVLDFEPAALLWQFHLNDAADPLVDGADGGVARYHHRPRSALLAWAKRRLSRMHRRSLVRDRGLENLPYDLQRQLARWDSMGRSLDELAEVARERGLDVFLFIYPTWPAGDDWSSYTPAGFEIVDRLAGRFRSLGFETLDLVDLLRGESTERYWLETADPWHPNVAGHQRIADELFAWLRPKLAERVASPR
jgi:lysophospholipase L1-like esterase